MAHPLPPPGPDHYAARRARWLAPPPHTLPPRVHISTSHTRLQRLLAHTDPHTDLVWNRGIDQVWKGLVNGKRLKHRLPMSVVVKVIYTAWRRDPETWPEDALVPDSDQDSPSARPP